MSPLSMQTRVIAPSHPNDVDLYLSSLDLNAPNVDSRTVFDHFNELAAQGYDLSLADGTMEMEARRTLGVMPSYMNVIGFHEETRLLFNREGKQTIEYQGSVHATVANEEYKEIAESKFGSVHAAFNAFTKLLAKNYDFESIQLTSYHVQTLRTNNKPCTDDLANAASPTRVTIEFSTTVQGREVSFAVQDVQAGVMGASVLAVAKGLEYGLLKQGVTPK